MVMQYAVKLIFKSSWVLCSLQLFYYILISDTTLPSPVNRIEIMQTIQPINSQMTLVLRLLLLRDSQGLCSGLQEKTSADPDKFPSEKEMAETSVNSLGYSERESTLKPLFAIMSSLSLKHTHTVICDSLQDPHSYEKQH